MIYCNTVQERIARGDALHDDERDHTAACDSCAATMAEFSVLEAALDTFGSEVPAGFANRMMARVASQPEVSPRRSARRVHLAVAYAAGALAAVNVTAFLARIFVASVAFGGAW